ncbi:CAAX prenyl protease-related protein [Gemmatimonas sp.]|uniref:CAAX prenyl protease-related protein n=1 Tax=Gemmatimonas sp. TaxID=1962908 RepID=UPI00286A75FF|nr:CAAX prenyl protease-related protein [Gemmatimonas sp.]
MSELSLNRQYPSLPWIAPFAVFMILLAVGPSLPIPQPWESILRVGVLIAVMLTISKDVVLSLRVRHVVPSVLLGLAVCAMWVAPDQLFPGWREHWLFQNSITGTVKTTIAPAELADPLVVMLRVVRAALLVPILEELFWRGWLPRWIVNNDWQKVPLGTFNVLAFVATAVLFASEHGPFWEVGLLCGFIYNWWMWKTKSLGDLVLVHAVTNAALSGFVMVTKQYAYWM